MKEKTQEIIFQKWIKDQLTSIDNVYNTGNTNTRITNNSSINTNRNKDL